MSREKSAIFIDGKTEEVSDGYHTFGELYEHRCALFVAVAFVAHQYSWRSHVNNEGKGLAGWFLAGVELPTGMITYHLPDKLWSLTDFMDTLDRAPLWDGHTSADVVNRLVAWVVSGVKR